MANTIDDLMQKIVIANTNPNKGDIVEGPDKKRDSSYQGESTPVTLPTDDEADAIPRLKQEHEDKKQQKSTDKSEDNSKKARHLNKTVKDTTEGYQ